MLESFYALDTLHLKREKGEPAGEGFLMNREICSYLGKVKFT